MGQRNSRRWHGMWFEFTWQEFVCTSPSPLPKRRGRGCPANLVVGMPWWHLEESLVAAIWNMKPSMGWYRSLLALTWYWHASALQAGGLWVCTVWFVYPLQWQWANCRVHLRNLVLTVPSERLHLLLALWSTHSFLWTCSCEDLRLHVLTLTRKLSA